MEKALALEAKIHAKYGILDADFDASEFGQFWRSQQPDDDYVAHKTYILFLAQKLDFSATLHPDLTPEILQQFRDKITHNEIPFNNYLKNKLATCINSSSKMDENFAENFIKQLLAEIFKVYDTLMGNL